MEGENKIFENTLKECNINNTFLSQYYLLHNKIKKIINNMYKELWLCE